MTDDKHDHDDAPHDWGFRAAVHADSDIQRREEQHGDGGAPG